MSANQCGRYPFGILGRPLIFETFSVCDVRSQGANGISAAMTTCCAPGSAIRSFQCWYYCAVEESDFPTWLSCVATAINTTEGAYCQRADQSPVSTATAFPISHQPPVSPAPQPPWPVITTIATTARSVESSSVVATTTQMPDVVPRSTPTKAGGSSNTSSNGTAPPLQITGNAPASTKHLELSTGGVLCALLVLSIFAL